MTNTPCRDYLLSAAELEQIRDWFPRYVRPFYEADSSLHADLKLKEDHSRRVSDEIVALGSQLNLNADQVRIAEVMGLMHDIGRFEQLIDYGTFADGKSIDHAQLGIKVLEKEQTLAALNQNTRELICKAVLYHNRLAIPEDETQECLFFTRLLRDADKLDILSLFAAYYHADPDQRSTAVELNLPDGPGFSQEILNALLDGKPVNMRALTCLNDFKILQLGWVYDVNFNPTREALIKRGYLERIRAALPSSKEIDHLYSRVIAYCARRFTPKTAVGKSEQIEAGNI